MPRHILHDEPRFCVVLELISSDINDRAAQFQPRMRPAVAVAKYVLRTAITLIVKVLSKQQRGVPASPMGEILQMGRQIRRVALFNRTAKGSGQPLYLLALIVCEISGDLFIHHGYISRVEKSDNGLNT